jgi:hypothetical protein
MIDVGSELERASRCFAAQPSFISRYRLLVGSYKTLGLQDRGLAHFFLALTLVDWCKP